MIIKKINKVGFFSYTLPTSMSVANLLYSSQEVHLIVGYEIEVFFFKNTKEMNLTPTLMEPLCLNSQSRI